MNLHIVTWRESDHSHWARCIEIGEPIESRTYLHAVATLLDMIALVQDDGTGVNQIHNIFVTPRQEGQM